MRCRLHGRGGSDKSGTMQALSTRALSSSLCANLASLHHHDQGCTDDCYPTVRCLHVVISEVSSSPSWIRWAGVSRPFTKPGTMAAGFWYRFYLL